MLSLVVARARGGAIGRDNTIPWFAPEDLAFFQRETTGGVVIMGRRTWESLPKKPLPRRVNVVVTSTPHEPVEGAVFLPFADAMDFARNSGHARIYGIGGAGIYAALLPHADRLLVTEVDLDVPDADAHFPDFDAADWRLVSEIPLRGGDPACLLREYLRK